MTVIIITVEHSLFLVLFRIFTADVAHYLIEIMSTAWFLLCLFFDSGNQTIAYQFFQASVVCLLHFMIGQSSRQDNAMIMMVMMKFLIFFESE